MIDVIAYKHEPMGSCLYMINSSGYVLELIIISAKPLYLLGKKNL